MAALKGDLSLMSLPEVLQWCEMGNKTGTLTLTYNGTKKIFYIQKGKIISVSSDSKEESLTEHLLSEKIISPSQLQEVLYQCRSMGLPLTGYLVSEKIVTIETLKSLLHKIAEKAFLEILRWKGGFFIFEDKVPEEILDGPVKLDVSFMLLQSLKLLDETNRDKGIDCSTIIGQLMDDIAAGRIELPPLPDIVIKLREVLDKDDVNISEVVKTIMADQILTSKILKIVNSAHYARYGKINSLQQAVLYLGLKSVVSIATIHALSCASPKNAERVKEILSHCFHTGLIARMLASFCSEDPEDAFVCGLLHDIGKTILLENIPLSEMRKENLEHLLEEFHAEAGFLLAQKWKFSDMVQDVIKFHHNPDPDNKNYRIVRLISASDRIANCVDSEEKIKEELSLLSDSLKCRDIETETVLEKVKKLSEEVPVF